MKSIKEHMLNEVRKPDGPIEGATVYDYYNEPWVVIDYCLIRERNKLQRLLKEYDTGSFGDEYRQGAYDAEEYAVAVHNADDERETAVFVWSPDGIWPEKR